MNTFLPFCSHIRLTTVLYSFVLAFFLGNAHSFLTTASARTMESAEQWVSAGIALGNKHGSRLGGSEGYFLLQGGGEFIFSKSLSAIADVELGIADTIPLYLRGGVRYRWHSFQLPLSPFAQGQLGTGVLFDVIGANLPFAALQLGGGLDYFLTARITAGLLLTSDFGFTMGERSIFTGTTQLMLRACYRL